MRRRVATLVLAAVLAGSLPGPAPAQPVPAGKLPAGVTPTHYRLELEVAPETERFSGEARIEMTLDQAMQVIWLHGRGLEVAEAYLLTADGTRVEASYAEVDDGGVARLETAHAVGPGAATLVIRYGAPFNQSLEGLYKVEQGDRAYAYTHFEPLSARRAFPSFDEPRFKAPFDLAVTIGVADVAVSNAPERETIDLGDGRRRVVFETTAPLPTYLVALAVGDFDVVDWAPILPSAVRSRPIPLRGIAPKGKGAELAYALEHTAALLAILEDYFASPYPYAKLDLVAAAAHRSSGMENAGAIFYRQSRILIGETPSVYQLRGFASLHAHELAHNWFGNLVTPAWWDDLWLNEAFATWMADRVVHAWRPAEFDDRGPVRDAGWAMRTDRLATARKIRQPIASNHDIAAAFDSNTYSKGGGVLSMIEQYIGAEAFRAGVRRYMARHRHGVATAEDFFAALSESARDPAATRAFRSFVEQPGAPLVSVDWSCEAGGAAEVTLAQSRSLPLGSKGDPAGRWSIPLCLAYPEDGARHSRCLLLAETATRLQLPTSACPAWILPNTQGAAYLSFALPDRGWDALTGILDRLPPGEALSVVGSLVAAYEAGLATSTQLLDAAEAAARSPHWDVAGAPMQALRDFKNFVLPEALRPAAMALMRRIYRPALARFDLSDAALARDEASSDLALLRGDLIWFLALDAEDPELRARLSRLAQAYLGDGSDGALHREQLHPNLVRVALMVAAGELGLPFAEALIERLQRSDDPVLREHIVRALGYQSERAIVERVWALILDPTVPRPDASELFRRQAQRVANRELLFDWMVANYDALIERLPRSHRAWLPWRASAFCDAPSRDRVAAFFAGRVEAHQGGPRALENVLEKIELCTAIAQAQRADAVAALKARE